MTKVTSQNTSVLAVLNVEKFIERLLKCVTLLDRIHDGFTTYLQTKRSSFTRFFFLADREILQIISNAGDARRLVDTVGLE